MIIPFTVFLPLALLVSVASIVMNALMLREQVRRRLAQAQPVISHEAAPQASGPLLPQPRSDGPSAAGARRPLFSQMVQRYILHEAQEKHKERALANDIELRHFSMSMLLLLMEDVPFFVMKTILLVRTVYQKDDVAVLASKKFCSAGYDAGAYVFILLDTMKSAGMLATKLMKVKAFPGLLAKRRVLQAKALKLAQRASELTADLVSDLSTTEMIAVEVATTDMIATGVATAEMTATELSDDDSCEEGPPKDGASTATETSSVHLPAIAQVGDTPASVTLAEPSYTVSIALRLTECASGTGGSD